MFLSYSSHFLIGFSLSFIGSIPFGMINVTVAETAMKKGLKAGIWVGFGAALIEFFQSFIAIKFTHLFVENPKIDFYFNAIALIVFFTLAVFYLFFQKPENPNKIKANKRKVKPFFKGILISSMNVLVFPYWIFYGTYLHQNGWLNLEINYITILCFGIFLGAFSVFGTFAKTGIWMMSKGPNLMKTINLFIGLIFLAFGILQSYKLY